MNSQNAASNYFLMLGEHVAKQWLLNDFLEAAFPEIASSAFEAFPPSGYITLNDVIELGLLSNTKVPQIDMDEMFGQPPLVVYNSADFHIVVLFWRDDDTSIHEHSFSGAFNVFHGSSLHTNWSFRTQKRLSSRLLLGDLLFRKVEYLATGTTRMIVAGKELIHATYHLGNPTVSIVIRTNCEVGVLPQYEYYVPGVAYASFQSRNDAQRRMQLLRMLLKSGQTAKFDEVFPKVIKSSDSYAAFLYVKETYFLLNNKMDRQWLINIACEKHICLEPYLTPMLDYLERQAKIDGIKKRITGNNPNLRLFLALLMNVPDREHIFALIRQSYPLKQPEVMVGNWIMELSEANALPIKLPPLWAILIPHILKAGSDSDAFQLLMSRNDLSLEAYDTGEIMNLIRGLRSWSLLSSLTKQSLHHKFSL